MAIALKESQKRQEAVDRKQEEDNDNNDMSDVVLNDDAMVGISIQD